MDWENTSQLNFDFNEFEHGIQNDSPVKTGSERDSDYDPERECLSQVCRNERIEATTQKEEKKLENVMFVL